MKIDSLSSVKAKNALNKTTFKMVKNTEKLTSGLQINRSADNAAGLAISEKMRSIIRGLTQSQDNTNDGISLVNVGEGALNEVHSILQRIREMAVQSANGTYMDETDREALQGELERLTVEVDRIAGSTEFNGIKLFQNEGYESEYDLTGYYSRFNTMFDDIYSSTQYLNEEIPLSDLLEQENVGKTNIIYTETVYEFETTQTPESPNSFTVNEKAYADALKAEIVPNIVNKITVNYPAFNYLNGTNIGIGLKLYSDVSSSTLAYVSAGAGSGFKQYQLAVNIAKADLTTESGRSALERTIAHEMIHAFMDEATASGMFGVAQDGSSVQEFPMWFTEGVAQTASGPGNWVKASGGLGLNEGDALSDISTALGKSDALLSSSASSTKAQYGTGYLAAMYLGYKKYISDGGTIDMSNPSSAAAAIATGVSDMMYDIIQGNSLNDFISENTHFTSISDFQNSFATDNEVLQFVSDLLPYTADGQGGIIAGNLSLADPVPNTELTGVGLFELNADNQTVKNYYPPEVNIFSGGSATVDGTPPVSGITPPPDVPTLVYPSDLFTVTGGAEGTDWSFDENTGVLTILSGTTLKISGGTATVDGTQFAGKIEIADNIGSVDVVLSGVDIDLSALSGDNAGIKIGEGNTVNLTLDNNTTSTIKASGGAAGIQLPDGAGATVIIDGKGTLNVSGGHVYGYEGGAGIGNADRSGSYSNNIIINGGTLNVDGGYGAAAIGASEGSNFGDITINGGNITAIAKNHGAGIGGGWYPSNIGDITITGGNIIATGIEHGTGIGSGCRGTVGNITISGDDTVVVAQGGIEGAGIGASWDGSAGTIQIDGGTIIATGGSKGAGIGSGHEATGGDIIINGGIITAKGETDAAGIGSGKYGTNTGIYINGGTISAKGGLTNDGGNIGGYLAPTADNATPGAAPLTIAPGLTIKAGDKGEGLYNTTGATTPDGTKLYAFKLDSTMLPSGFTFPVSARTTTGETYTWDDLQHMSEDAVYIWMNGEDHILEVTDANGTTESLDLVFYPNAGVWRRRGEPVPPDAKKPEYSDGNTTNYPVPLPPADEEDTTPKYSHKGIILQIGAYSENIFVIPQFYFSAEALKMDMLDISTRQNANDTIETVDDMVKRVSMMRSTYGAITNCLEHTYSNLVNTAENTTAAESQIRDTDMATEMVEYAKNGILSQAGQAMLAQANKNMSAVLSLISQ